MASSYSDGERRIGGQTRPTGKPRAASASEAASPASQAAIIRTVLTPSALSRSSSRSSRGRSPVAPVAPQSAACQRLAPTMMKRRPASRSSRPRTPTTSGAAHVGGIRSAAESLPPLSNQYGLVRPHRGRRPTPSHACQQAPHTRMLLTLAIKGHALTAQARPSPEPSNVSSVATIDMEWRAWLGSPRPSLLP
eukprot:scaffold308726_cov33-Tisochrysis_lutea.AAC.2